MIFGIKDSTPSLNYHPKSVPERRVVLNEGYKYILSAIQLKRQLIGLANTVEDRVFRNNSTPWPKLKWLG